ncbi:hypothetical protein METBIDRAFT_86898 [Metschnikowia bicuspidata var. bicuspidata NRRL YB-4993]|uniref:Uncharacterized protein n=1 Tax=Metschnikowia bicuspidata var. bicuspidata NRRL YB-4993 TaxID=869754 RepID=A0A1A0HE59_9ASCO|nr:hypothetical protein METBIDRAFT_86898 [Metschnikowia bicuspidata var. bicuspidata NRRL YB-4993]OBA22275.1 hypothetical protein METBIDRAFT_86898 [Metschnikowia bicuspidata var. bicuspidata NRRL YB-4993]
MVYGSRVPNYRRSKTFAIMSFLPHIKLTMPSASGFILSTVLGLAARRLQIQIVGKPTVASWNSVQGYALSVSAFTTGYLICEHFVERNRQLLTRRLLQLREQRSQLNSFQDFDLDAEHRLTAQMRTSRFFELFEKMGEAYK